MIACDRALVYRGHTNRLTWASLGCYLIRRWCSRQQKLANPLIRKGQTLKKLFAYSATIICWIRGFCHVFLLFYKDYIFLSAAKILLVQLSVIFVHVLLCPYWIRPWHLLRGEKKTNKQTNKQTGLQARFSPSLSSCQQALVAPPPKQLETRTSEPARKLVYRSPGDSRYLVIF